MDRKTARDFDQELLILFDAYFPRRARPASDERMAKRIKKLKAIPPFKSDEEASELVLLASTLDGLCRRSVAIDSGVFRGRDVLTHRPESASQCGG